jgi:hypothetical protein
MVQMAQQKEKLKQQSWADSGLIPKNQTLHAVHEFVVKVGYSNPTKTDINQLSGKIIPIPKALNFS